MPVSAAAAQPAPRNGIGTTARSTARRCEVIEDEPAVGLGELAAVDERPAVTPPVGPRLLRDHDPGPPARGQWKYQPAAIGQLVEAARFHVTTGVDAVH